MKKFMGGDLKWLKKYKFKAVPCKYIPGVHFTEKLSPVAIDTSTGIIIALVLYYFHLGLVHEAFDGEAAFLEPYMDIEMYVQWSEGIVELGFFPKNKETVLVCSYVDQCIAMLMQHYAGYRNLRIF